MTVFLRQGSVLTEVGPGGVLHSFFSTVALRLEAGKWGSRFPIVMESLYAGTVADADATAGLAEMTSIRRELEKLTPSYVIWDADDTSAPPPWGKEVGGHVKSLAQYWVTSTGRNLVDELLENFESLNEFGGTLDVLSQPPGQIPT